MRPVRRGAVRRLVSTAGSSRRVAVWGTSAPSSLTRASTQAERLSGGGSANTTNRRGSKPSAVLKRRLLDGSYSCHQGNARTYTLSVNVSAEQAAHKCRHQPTNRWNHTAHLGSQSTYDRGASEKCARGTSRGELRVHERVPCFGVPQGHAGRRAIATFLLKSAGVPAFSPTGWRDQLGATTVTIDDILDAAAMLWTAWRAANGVAGRLPTDRFQRGAKGLEMAIWA
jgi:hypothetical protein